MLMVYDHALTFGREVEWIWTLKWRLPKVLFLINRYITSPLILVIGLANLVFPVALSTCNVIVHLSPWVTILSFAISEAVLVIRVCALYAQRKIFVRLLVGFYALDMIAVIVNSSFLTQETIPTYFYEFLPGCWSYILRTDLYSFWIPFAILDGIVALCTVYRVFMFRDCRSPTVSLLARDSIVYYVIIFVTLIVNEVSFRIGLNFDLMIVSECIACISISRMMMNIRGLIMDDPKHTLHLQTIQFTEQISQLENIPETLSGSTMHGTYEMAEA